MSEILLTIVYSLVIINTAVGLLGFFPLILTDDCPTEAIKELVLFPALEFIRLRKSYNIVGSVILTGIPLLIYPAALGGVAVYGITVGIVRAFNYVFRNREGE